MIKAIRSLLPVLALSAVLGGCATTAALRSGQQAETLQDYDRAVVEYTKVLQKKPNDRDARQGLERAKARASQDHTARGRRFESLGRLEQAAAEFQLALELNPTSAEVDEALRAVRTQLRTKIAITRDDKTQLESLIESAKDLAPLGLELPEVRMPASLTFPGASSRDIYGALGKFANVSVVFDPQFRDQNVTLDLRNQTLDEALRSVSGATRNFFRVTAPRTVTVIPDTPAKRREYEEEIVRIFPLSNADLKETADLLRIVIDARRVSTTTATNSIVIRDTPDRVRGAGRIIDAIDKARPEVIVEVELLEFDRTKLREYGLQLSSSGGLGLDGSATISPDTQSLRDLRGLSQGNILFGSLPGIYYKMLKSDGSARTLANTQLRTIEGMPARARFGEEVPVPITTFAQIATGGVPQQPITSYQYRNVGVNIDITPRAHHDDAVSLVLKLQVSSVSGAGFGGLPSFGNREVDNVIRLKDGETNMLAGLIRDDERTSMTGIPGLTSIPLIGRLFGMTRKESQETDIVMTLTPRIVRVLNLDEDDLRPFRLGRDGDGAGGGTVIELPIQPQLPPRDPAQNQEPGGPPQVPVLPPTQGPIFAPQPGR
jgi:general secretion pathway protein D